MSEVANIVEDIKTKLKENAPHLTDSQKSRMYSILNSDNPNFEGYGNKISEIEKIVKTFHVKHRISNVDAIEIFKTLIKSNVHDEKFAGVFLLNRFRREFNEDTINTFHDALNEHADTWALVDSTCIRVIGPFLAKNDNFAKSIIETWSEAENMWIRRASLVILLKIIMVKKEFDEKYVFAFVQKMLNYSEDYIHKGIGWLLKTCSKYKPDIIISYLDKNKTILPRLILRYASEKLPKETRAKILKK